MQQAVSAIQVNKAILLSVSLLICFSSLFSQRKGTDGDYNNLLINASELYQKKNFIKAEKQLQKITDKYPEKSASYFLLSKIYEESGLIALYEKYAEKAYIRDTANKEYLNNIINAYHENSNSALLKKFLLKAIPDRKEIDYKILLALNDFTGFEEVSTIKQLNEIELQNPDNDQVIIIKYQIYNYLRKFDDARSEMEKLIERNPDDIRYRVSYIQTLKALKDTTEFLNQIKIIDSIDVSLDNTWMLTTDYLITKNDKDKITDYLKSVISNNKIDTLRKWQILTVITSRVNSSSIYNKDIITWIFETNYTKKHFKYLVIYNYYQSVEMHEKAIESLKKYAFMVKSDYSSWTTILQYYYSKNDFLNCFLYCDSLEQLKEVFLPNYYRIMCYYQLKDYKNLSKTVKKSRIEKYSTDEFKTFLYNVLAMSCYESNHIRRSYKYYEKILKIDTSDLVTYNNYAYFLSLNKKSLRKAETMSRKTIEKEPNNSTYLDTYAWILFKMKEYDDALYYIEEAIKYNGIGNDEIMDHYGDILFKKGRTESAVSAWEISQKLRPDIKKEIKITKYSKK